MEHNYKIYMHKNKINGKVYIGQTSKSLDERCGKNGSGYIGCIRFYNAIQKYGWDNFEHEIIEDNILDRETANKKEIFILNYIILQTQILVIIFNQEVIFLANICR